MSPRELSRVLTKPEVLAGLIVLVLSYLTYVHHFWHPASLFWDENYHIASAQKYLNGIFFMEPHPPLGKLLIALGEKILGLNSLNDQFIGTDYGTSLPPDFSFAGYRFFPVILAWLTAPVLYAIFLLLVRHSLWALFLSFLYIFDNATIVHSRSAMLESTLLFFSVLTILAFLLALEWKDRPQKIPLAALLFGCSFGAVMATKLFGLILILLVPVLLFMLWPRWRQFAVFCAWAIASFLIIYVGIWHIPFSLAERINTSLPDAGYYQASEEYKQILTEGRNGSLAALPIMLRDSWKFVGHCQRGVPRLDLCKKDENGSPWFLWPIGARTINYRWETPDGHSYRYLYLQSNPVAWGVGLLGLFLAACLLVFPLLFPSKQPLQARFLLLTFLGLYVAYMAAISTIDRVTYLYHYFLPLIFSFLLFGLVVREVSTFASRALQERHKTAFLLGLAAVTFMSFEFFHPLTYYGPLTEQQFERRNLLRLWELRCVNCPSDSILTEATYQ